MVSRPYWIKSLIVAVGVLWCTAEVGLAAEAAALDHFERRIRPVLAERCLECHGPGRARNGLRLDSAAGMLAGGDSGPAIVPGDAEASLLVRAISYHDSALQMPPRDRLPEHVVEDFARWVEAGAVDPREEGVQTEEQRWAGSSFDVAEARQHWAFSPVQAGEPPAVEDAAWGRDPIDAFILAELEAHELTPAEEADRRTLIRRAYFDLIGLPPTPEQVEAFVADESEDAFEQVVDALLSTPQYGERWGRHWLDVVRYADSKDARGAGGAGDIANAWRYRDWMVNAFNDDYPYDRFIVDQVAGDLVEGDYDADRVVATAMLALGTWEHGDSDKRKMMTDIVDDQVDVVSRTVMGMTVSCARCHDHVFDPIGIEDYYALAGYFFSSHIVPEPGNPAAGTPMLQVPLLSAEQQEQREQAGRLAERLQGEVEAAEQRHRRAQVAARLKDLAVRLAAKDDAGDAPADDVLLDRLLALAGDGREPPPHEAGLFTQRKDGGQPGLTGWGAASTPWIMANASEEPRRAATWTIPPRSLAVHPSPDRAVGAGWRSDISSELAVRATIHDGDPNGGNGIAWSLELTRDGVRQELKAGVYDRGGRAEAEATVTVQPGDVVSLVIDPRNADHSFDTTIVQLTIEAADGEQRWELAEVIDDIAVSNPHPGGSGGGARWYFYTTGGEQGAPAAAPAGSVLAGYVTAVRDGVPDEAARLASRLAELLDGPAPDEGTADARLIGMLTSPAGPVWRGLDVAQVLDDPAREELNRLRGERAEAQRLATSPVPVIEAIREGGVPGSEHEGFADARVHYRGRYDRLGETIPRGFPRVLADAEEQPDIEPNTSGRLQLARWLVRDDHPLTARVMVNRIWLHHFGSGLVTTPDDFGTHGAKPSHPELLDHLAEAFIDSGWSVKAMHRRIMLSSTYRQSTRAASRTLAADPDNRLVGRMPRRRLEAEPLRDAMLAVTGELDLTRGGPAADDLGGHRRTLYLRTVRSDRTGYDLLFDAADPGAIISQREESTVAPQALFMMNHPFVLDRAAALAERAAEEAGEGVEPRIDFLYRLLYARPPVEQEMAIGRELIREAGGGERAWRLYTHILLCGNEFMYVE